ncbi:benenodin family lasso peptide [Sphingobium terrigena]|uniref:Benenodin family lasso peptide n=1 Tax=Sphingobium terrigena TaxID=2304063 RepID=A0A418YMI6_9SPHN|nr:benenodin family lasso peptide [Sphingobium terrigena]
MAVRGYRAILSRYTCNICGIGRSNSGLSWIHTADQEEHIMQRNDQHRDDELIDLGGVIEETKGGAPNLNDTAGQQQPFGGALTDD